MCLELRRHPRHSCTRLLGPTNKQRDAPPSIVPVRHWNGAAASPTGARTARRAPEAGAAARERVLLVCLRWGINSVVNRTVRGCKNNAYAVSLGPWAVATDRAATPGPSGVHLACVVVPRGLGGVGVGARHAVRGRAGMQGSLVGERSRSAWTPWVRGCRVEAVWSTRNPSART